MKPKRQLRKWVKVALLLLPEVVMIGLLFFIAINIKELSSNQVIIIENNCQCNTTENYWGVLYE